MASMRSVNCSLDRRLNGPNAIEPETAATGVEAAGLAAPNGVIPDDIDSEESEADGARTRNHRIDSPVL